MSWRSKSLHDQELLTTKPFKIHLQKSRFSGPGTWSRRLLCKPFSALRTWSRPWCRASSRCSWSCHGFGKGFWQPGGGWQHL